MISLAGSELMTAHQALGHMEMKPMFSSEVGLQEVDEGSDSGQVTPVFPPLEGRPFLDAGSLIQQLQEEKMFPEEQNSIVDQPVNSCNVSEGLPRSVSFMSCKQDILEKPQKNSRSPSFCLAAAGRQRKKSVSYDIENSPIFEYQTVSGEEHPEASLHHTAHQPTILDVEESDSSSDTGTATSIVPTPCEEEDVEEPWSLILTYTSVHVALLHPAAPQHFSYGKVLHHLH